MSFKITIASGKGGTGKTSVAVNLYEMIAQKLTDDVVLVDCDVEEPNAILFFQNLQKTVTTDIVESVASIDPASCMYCARCVEWCVFNAIVVIPPVKFAEVNPSLCHSCGACTVACEHNAIRDIPETIGRLTTYATEHGKGIIEGRLKIGSAMQTMMIKRVKQSVIDQHEIILYDAPPGTSCPVVESIADSNYVILVTEPTPFGLHDLKLAVDLLRKTGKDFGVIINKAGLGDEKVYHFLKEENIELLGELFFDKDYASQYAKGSLMDNIPEHILSSYNRIFDKVEKKFMVYEGNNYFKW
ncbi:MAG: P-loop NTPase [Bacteroidota bacterium]